MREIKFRAWVPPITDGEITMPGHTIYELQHYVIRAVRTETKEVPAHLGFQHATQGIYELNEQLASYGNRLMQFTGLKDKNGKDVYENDLLRSAGGVSEMVWHYNRWAIRNEQGRLEEVGKDFHYFFEVCGNKYEGETR